MIRPGIRRIFKLPGSDRASLAREADEEIRLHIELRVEELMRDGRTAEEAREEAWRRFGTRDDARRVLQRTAARRARRLNAREWIGTVWQDVRQGARQLRRNRGFAAVVVATLALGIGGTTAVFSVVQAVLVAPLPYQQPGQLVRFYQQEPDNPTTRSYLAGPHFTSLRSAASRTRSRASRLRASRI